MASKRAFTLITGLARLASPAPAPACRTLVQQQLQPRRRHLPVSLPCTTTRLAHGIPRSRNPSPFKQDPQPATTSTKPSSASPTTTATTTTTTNSQPQPPKTNIEQQPHYELTFTCKPCDTRSRHRVSKQGYHHGSVLIACPECKNRHVISDHLKIFGDTATTVEELLRSKGELIKRGTLGEEGDLEFWEDGTSTVREPWEAVKGEPADGEEEGLAPGATFKSVRPGDKKAHQKADQKAE